MNARTGKLDASQLRALYRIAVGEPRYYVGPTWANRAGLQLLRVAGHKLAYGMRARRQSPEVACDVQVLARDGILFLPDFLPPDAFQRVASAFARLGSSDRLSRTSDREGSGVHAIEGTLTASDPDSCVIVDALARSARLRSIVSAIMRRAAVRDPYVLYQHLWLDADGVDRGDETCVLHADRYFPSVKAFFYVADAGEQSGVMTYCPGSHRFSMARLRHEYFHSIREAETRQRHGKGLAWFLSHVSEQQVPVAAEHRAAMGLQERPLVATKNTLVICNHAGFHARGRMQPGSERKLIRLMFQSLELPWYAPALTSLAKTVRGRSAVAG